MGLDIAFNRQQVIDAGLVLEMVPNATDEQLAFALEDEYPDPNYIQWMYESTECVHVPYCNHLVSNDSIGDTIVVRANKWGKTYEPLTAWLTQHDINWNEF